MMHCVWCRERGLCDKTERELEGVRLELSAMHEAMASLHGEMGAMQREVRHPSLFVPSSRSHIILSVVVSQTPCSRVTKRHVTCVWQLDSNGEREAGLRERADKAERILGSVKAERETVEEDKRRVEAELSSLKQAARAAMLELASQRQKRDAEVCAESYTG